MIEVFLAKYWKQLGTLIIIVVLAAAAYDKVYTLGYNAASAECNKTMQEYKDQLGTRIDNIESISSEIAGSNEEFRKAIKNDFNKIIASINGKPLYTIEQGKCKPTDDYVEWYNEAVDKANEK